MKIYKSRLLQRAQVKETFTKLNLVEMPKQWGTPETYAPNVTYEFMDNDGCCFDDAVSYLVGGVLRLCGCGRPTDMLRYLESRLAALERRRYEEYSIESRDHLDSLFHTPGEKDFVYQVLEEKGLEEHGGSSPGWLTSEGEDFLEAVREVLGIDVETLRH